MSALNLLGILMGLLSICFDCRFLNRALGPKHSVPVTFAVLLVCGELYGWANVYFQIAGTILTNELYAFAGCLILYRLLYHGSISKAAFYALILQCAPDIVVCALLPFSYAIENNHSLQMAILSAVSYMVVIIKGILLEYAGRRLQSLRNDLPVGYPFYLLITFFVAAAASTVMDLALYASGDSLFRASLVGSVFAAAGALLLIFVVISIDRQLSVRLAEQRAILQADHYKSREADWQRTVQFRHDMKNHLLCLDGLLREGKADKALAYTDTLVHAVERLGERVITGNDFVDAIVNEKRAEAQSQGIVFTADMTLPAECRISPPDLCCIFSNVMDNAIEACGRLERGRWIEARAFVRQGQLVAEVRNSFDGQRPRFHRREDGRGYGLLNVRRAVEKYGGIMELAPAGDRFVFSAMIPL